MSQSEKLIVASLPLCYPIFSSLFCLHNSQANTYTRVHHIIFNLHQFFHYANSKSDCEYIINFSLALRLKHCSKAFHPFFQCSNTFCPLACARFVSARTMHIGLCAMHLLSVTQSIHGDDWNECKLKAIKYVTTHNWSEKKTINTMIFPFRVF